MSNTNDVITNIFTDYDSINKDNDIGVTDKKEHTFFDDMPIEQLKDVKNFNTDNTVCVCKGQSKDVIRGHSDAICSWLYMDTDSIIDSVEKTSTNPSEKGSI